MSNLKDHLYQELYIKARVIANGINVKPAIFKELALGSEYMEQVHGLAESDRHTHVGIDFPCYFTSPNGFAYNFVSFEHLYYVAPADNTVIDDVFRIEEGLFQV